ncbi:MAG: kynureninase [Gemmatimonadetes bacterium]|nr:MAG: kynureninase [Gemmatimonadota bacterium]
MYASPNALAPHYRRSRVAERLLLTGHSHQAWPDVGFEAQQQAWLDAAEHLDAKWERAFAMADRVRRGFARLLDDPQGTIALGANTHELVVRWLSALRLGRRPRLVTTTAEFHTIRRQLDRLAEEGIAVVKVPALPAATLAERLARTVDDRTAAVLVSAVLYENAHIVPNLAHVLEACRRVGAELLVDAYHALNVVPFSLRTEGLAEAFMVGGGYKYCQLGEGNGFLRIPPECTLRPVITGWFSEFEALAAGGAAGPVTYGPGAARFAGATFDPTSHYRAARVFDFFEELELTPDLLRQVSQHQVGLLASLFDALDADPRVITRDRAVTLSELGGFLALQSPRAEELCRRLRDRSVAADFRADTLRLGPAPYVSDLQLRTAIDALGSVVRELAAA